MKIQHPGVSDSIDSDLANLTLLTRLPGLVPAGMGVAPLLARVREQLKLEADYDAEARATTEFGLRLGADPDLWVPAVVPEHCTSHITASKFSGGVPLDAWAAGHAPQAQRDHVAAALVRLAVRELFEMGLVQTDLNFGNYLFEAGTGKVTLLDFGAAERVQPNRVTQLAELGRAMRDGDRQRIANAATVAGFISAEDTLGQSRAVVDMLLAAGEPLQQAGTYDFERSDLVGRLFAQGRAQFFGDGFGRPPPPDLLFLQRKFVGTFLLCVQLRVERPDLASDPRWRKVRERIVGRDELVPEIARSMTTRSIEEWVGRFDSFDIPCSPINDYRQVFEEEQVVHRGLRVDMEREGGVVSTIASPLRLCGTPPAYVLPPPTLGNATDEVLANLLGLDAPRIEDLRARRII